MKMGQTESIENLIHKMMEIVAVLGKYNFDTQELIVPETIADMCVEKD